MTAQFNYFNPGVVFSIWWADSDYYIPLLRLTKSGEEVFLDEFVVYLSAYLEVII